MKKLLLIGTLFLGSQSFAETESEKKEERKPASATVSKGLSGDVEVKYQSLGTLSPEVFQIIDRTYNVICYGNISSSASSMSCVPMPR